MEDIIKSGILVIVLIGSLVFSKYFPNEDKEEITERSEKIELKKERDIHIPL